MTSPAWLAQLILIVLAALGLALNDLPTWLMAVLVIGAVAGAIVYQVQHHKTQRDENHAAVAIQQAQAEKAGHDAAAAQAAVAKRLADVSAIREARHESPVGPASALGVSRETAVNLGTVVGGA